MQQRAVSISPDLYRAYAVLFGNDANAAADILKYLKASSLKKAYRKKAFETHPDRAAALAKSPLSLEERFREVNLAYNQLNSFLEYPWRYPGGMHPNRRAHAPARRRQRTHSAAEHNRHQGMTEHLWQGGLPKKRLLFGRFLYYSGIISMKSLIAAIVWQRNERPMVGSIAMGWDWLDRNDVRSIIALRRAGEKFCACALRCGYISGYQRDILLARQKMLQPKIGRFFVDNGIVAADEMKRIVEQFHAHNRKHRRR